MKAKESASRYRKRSTELRGQGDKLANPPRNTCSDKGMLGASRSSMTDESQGKVEAGRSILLGKRGVDVGSRYSSMTGESKGRSRRVALFFSANEWKMSDQGTVVRPMKVRERSRWVALYFSANEW